MKDKVTVNYGKQIAAWLTLLVIVWIFGSMLLNAASKSSEEKPSDELKPKAEQQQAQPQSSQNKEKYVGELKILESGLNFRSAPKQLSSNVIKTLKKDEVLPIISSMDGWYEVMSGNQKGFVTSSTRYVKVLKMNK